MLTTWRHESRGTVMCYQRPQLVAPFLEIVRFLVLLDNLAGQSALLLPNGETRESIEAWNQATYTLYKLHYFEQFQQSKT